MTTDLFERYGALDPADPLEQAPEQAPDWAGILTTIDDRIRESAPRAHRSTVPGTRPRRGIVVAVAAAAIMIVAALGLGLLLVALRLGDVPIVGKVPIAIVVVVMLLILGGVFAASFAVESALDAFLGILGWGPLMTVVGVLAAIQGLLIGAGITGVAGLAEYL
jgi:hypothetical protein